MFIRTNNPPSRVSSLIVLLFSLETHHSCASCAGVWLATIASRGNIPDLRLQVHTSKPLSQSSTLASIRSPSQKPVQTSLRSRQSWLPPTLRSRGATPSPPSRWPRRKLPLAATASPRSRPEKGPALIGSESGSPPSPFTWPALWVPHMGFSALAGTRVGTLPSRSWKTGPPSTPSTAT